MKNILVCGSVAIDTILQFNGDFSSQIQPDNLADLSVAFLTEGMRREFGGCAGNIAYAVRQLGQTPIVCATVGSDATAYLQRLDGLGIPTQWIAQRDDAFTAQATLITDNGGRQITAFHPGAMAMAHENPIPSRDAVQADIAILSPDGKEATLLHAQQLHEAGVPIVFDPGQGLPVFDATELRQLIQLSDWLIVNEYEAEMLSDTLGETAESLAAQVQTYIVTKGKDGCTLYEQGKDAIHIAAPDATEELDPTGCGDAFRGGLLYGITNGWTLEKSCALGNRMGAHKVAHHGGQNYTLPRNFVNV